LSARAFKGTTVSEEEETDLRVNIPDHSGNYRDNRGGKSNLRSDRKGSTMI
jgi:hypothetical protein